MNVQQSWILEKMRQALQETGDLDIVLWLAAQEGYVLANLSRLEANDDDLVDDTEYNRGKRDGWNESVACIEIIDLEEE